MLNIYYNIMPDENGLFGEYFLIISSNKKYYEKHDNVRIKKIAHFDKLTKVSEFVYAFNESLLDDIKKSLKDNFFILSTDLKSLYDYNEPINEILNPEKEKDETDEIKSGELNPIETEEITIKIEETFPKVEETVIEANIGDIVTIKNWKDLLNLDYVYSYLLKYKDMLKDKFDPILFSHIIAFKNKDFFETLKNNGIITSDFIDVIKNFYPEKLYSIGHNHKDGVFNRPTDVTFFEKPEMLNNSDPEKHIEGLYQKQKDFYDNTYLYWMSLFANESLINKKALLLGTIDIVKAITPGTVTNLFEFELKEVDSKIKNFKINSTIEMISKETYIPMSHIEPTSTSSKTEYIYSYLDNSEYEEINDIKIKKNSNKIIIVQNYNEFMSTGEINESIELNNVLLDWFKIRGLKTDLTPFFYIPSYVNNTKESIQKLLSGIDNLSYSNQLEMFLNNKEEYIHQPESFDKNDELEEDFNENDEIEEGFDDYDFSDEDDPIEEEEDLPEEIDEDFLDEDSEIVNDVDVKLMIENSQKLTNNIYKVVDPDVFEINDFSYLSLNDLTKTLKYGNTSMLEITTKKVLKSLLKNTFKIDDVKDVSFDKKINEKLGLIESNNGIMCINLLITNNNDEQSVLSIYNDENFSLQYLENNDYVDLNELL